MIRALTAEGEELYATWTGDAPQGTVTVKSLSPIQAIDIDPYEMSLDINRFNNHLPRRVLVHWPFVGSGIKDKLPLDAYVINVSLLGISGGSELIMNGASPLSHELSLPANQRNCAGMPRGASTQTLAEAVYSN